MLVGAFSAIVKSSFEALVQSDNGDPRAELGTLIIHRNIFRMSTFSPTSGQYVDIQLRYNSAASASMALSG